MSFIVMQELEIYPQMGQKRLKMVGIGILILVETDAYFDKIVQTKQVKLYIYCITVVAQLVPGKSLSDRCIKNQQILSLMGTFMALCIRYQLFYGYLPYTSIWPKYHLQGISISDNHFLQTTLSKKQNSDVRLFGFMILRWLFVYEMGCQILRHNDLAVNNMDKIPEELPIIQQQLRTKLQQCTANPLHKDIVRLPLQLYRFCKNIFKRQKEVHAYLLHLFLSEFYFKDVKSSLIEVQKGNTQDLDESVETHSAYMRMLFACKDNVTVYLSQLFLRFCILGVTLRMGQKGRDAAFHRIRSLVKQLQLELLISGGSSFSEVVEAELEVLGEEFGCLEFYQGLREAFVRCDACHVQQWIENALQERRRKFQQDLKVSLEGKQQRKDTQKKLNKQKRVTISLANMDKEDGLASKQPISSSGSQQSAVKLLSVSEIASIMRQSGGPSTSTSSAMPRIRHTFVYRSSRKFSSQEVTDAESYSQPEPSYHSPLKQMKSLQKSRQKMDQSLMKVVQPLAADCKALCDETPPRASRKIVQ